jgi:hypothetical protein
MRWKDMVRELFATPTRGTSPRLRNGRFDLGVCPGCRGLRLMNSPRCEHCGSTASVTADA